MRAVVEKVQLDCLVCHGALEPGDLGRPARYCSIACRRTAEYEIRRVNRGLENLESERHALRLHLAEWAINPPGGTSVTSSTETRVTAIGGLIAEGTERLRLLPASGAKG